MHPQGGPLCDVYEMVSNAAKAKKVFLVSVFAASRTLLEEKTEPFWLKPSRAWFEHGPRANRPIAMPPKKNTSVAASVPSAALGASPPEVPPAKRKAEDSP